MMFEPDLISTTNIWWKSTFSNGLLTRFEYGTRFKPCTSAKTRTSVRLRISWPSGGMFSLWCLSTVGAIYTAGACFLESACAAPSIPTVHKHINTGPDSQRSLSTGTQSSSSGNVFVPRGPPHNERDSLESAEGPASKGLLSFLA